MWREIDVKGANMDTQSAIPETVRSLYARPCIRGRRITRMDEQSLGQMELDPETAWRLGRENIGVFVGGCWSLDDTVRRLRRLEADGVRPCWIVVAWSKQAAAAMAENWFREIPCDSSPSELELPMRYRNIILATPECLRDVDRSTNDEVAGVILWDDECIVYQARGGESTPFRRNDRPQHVANFRNRLGEAGWTPPFFLLTTRRAKSVNTHSVARAFCLDGFWFVHGGSLSCGQLASSAAETDLDHTYVTSARAECSATP
jgi:hypothetical protein